MEFMNYYYLNIMLYSLCELIDFIIYTIYINKYIYYKINGEISHQSFYEL